MSGLKDKIRRDKPGRCNQCGQMEAWHVYSDICNVCAMVNYLHFRHIMNWPLDDDDKRRLGLIP